MGEEMHLQDEYVKELEELPPSAKLVFKTLQYEGELTQQDLATETRLHARTVRSAIAKLEENGIVSSRISFVDARKDIYSLAITCQEIPTD